MSTCQMASPELYKVTISKVNIDNIAKNLAIHSVNHKTLHSVKEAIEKTSLLQFRLRSSDPLLRSFF